MGMEVPLAREAEMAASGNMPGKYPQGCAIASGLSGVPSAATVFPIYLLRR